MEIEKIALDAALAALNGLCANSAYDGDNEDTATDAVEIGIAFAKKMKEYEKNSESDKDE